MGTEEIRYQRRKRGRVNATEELLGGKVETQCNGNLLESKKETDGPETRGWKAQIPSIEPNTTSGGKIRKSMK